MTALILGQSTVLLFARGPSNIAAATMAPILPRTMVFIDGILHRWPWPHVSKESLEAITPMATNSNALPAVVAVANVFGVIAACLNGLPALVLRWCLPTDSLSMSFGTGNQLLSVETTATDSNSVSQTVANNRFLATALTNAKPLDMTIRTPSIRPDGLEPTEMLTSEINRCGHNAVYHIGTWQCE